MPLSTGYLHNTQVIRSEFPGAGELLPYYYFLKNRWAEKMVFLHDSMLMRRQFTEEELNMPVRFHWHFETHQWDDWGDPGKIDYLLAYLKKSNELIDFNWNKSLWHSCFGVASIIDLNVIDYLEETYTFPTALTNVVKSRLDRMALERLLAILIFKENYVTKSNCSNFGDIHQFPRAGHVDEAFVKELEKSYPGAILKTWHAR